MADEVKNVENPEKTYSKSEVEEMIQKRLRNQGIKNEELQMQLQELQQQMQSQVSQEPQMQSTGAPSLMENNGQNDASMGANTPQASQNPMDEDQIRKILAEQQAEQDYHHYVMSVNKMRSEDDEFNKLADQFKENQKIMPNEVAMHLAKSLPYKQAKKAFSKVMGNDLDYLKMMNHYQHGMLRGDWTPYQQWVQGLMVEPPTEGKEHTPVPELKESESFSGSPRMDNVDKYLSNF